MTAQTLAAPDAPFRLTAPIEHITKLDDGTLLVHCTVTSEAPDSQGEIIDYDAFKAAAPGLMKWAVLGEMHDPSRQDAGTILQLYFDDASRKVEADVHVVDPVAVKKVANRVYKMVSIGGVKLATQIVQVGGRTFRKITRLIADELSLVPRGANPDALIAKQFVLAKRAQETEMTDAMDAGLTSPLGEPVATAAEARTPEQVAIDETREALAKAEESTADINDLPDSDFAYIEPGGKKDDQGKTVPRSLRHFPIQDAAHVRNALARLSTSPFEAQARPKVEAAAKRLGIGQPAESKKVRKEARKMAKAAKVAKAAAAPLPPEPPAEGEATAAADAPKPPFPGAKPPFKSKKAARKARKMAKAAAHKTRATKIAAFAKGKNKTMGALAEALEAITCAMSEEADEGDTDAVKALQGIADAIQQQLTTEAAEPDTDDDFDPDMAMAYAKGQRKLAKRAPRLAKRLGRLRKANGKLRKRAGTLRKQRRELRKAAFFTEVLTKSGARHNATDRAAIQTIYTKTLELGAPFDQSDAVPQAEAVTDTGSSESAPLAKADPTTIMREALAGILPTDKLNAIEARLAAQAETAKAQGELLAKIARSPSGGGPATPYAPIFRGAAYDGEVTDKASALAKAATLIDDPRLKEQVGEAAAFESIRRARGG
jgi:hypothetical protein